MVKNLPANAEDTKMQFQYLGQEDPLRREWQPTPGFLPGKILWVGESSGLQSVGSWGCT